MATGTHSSRPSRNVDASPPQPASAGGTAGRLAAGLVVAAVLALGLAALGPDPQRRGGRSSPRASAPPPAAPALPALPPDVWREAFPLVHADLHLSPAELKATPSTPGMAAVVALNRALKPYRAGDDQKAAVELEGVLLDHPEEYRAALYLGVARLFIDEPQAAIESLRQAQQSTNADVLADAEWYILVGIARLREPDQAETDATALCARGGPASARPCRAVAVLAAARAAARP